MKRWLSGRPWRSGVSKGASWKMKWEGNPSTKARLCETARGCREPQRLRVDWGVDGLNGDKLGLNFYSIKE